MRDLGLALDHASGPDIGRYAAINQVSNTAPNNASEKPLDKASEIAFALPCAFVLHIELNEDLAMGPGRGRRGSRRKLPNVL